MLYDDYVETSKAESEEKFNIITSSEEEWYNIHGTQPLIIIGKVNGDQRD